MTNRPVKDLTKMLENFEALNKKLPKKGNNSLETSMRTEIAKRARSEFRGIRASRRTVSKI